MNDNKIPLSMKVNQLPEGEKVKLVIANADSPTGEDWINIRRITSYLDQRGIHYSIPENSDDKICPKYITILKTDFAKSVYINEIGSWVCGVRFIKD